MGGTRSDPLRKERGSLSLLVLDRGSRFDRQQLLGELAEADIGDILWVEGPRVSYEIEPLFRRYPQVRFLLLQQQVSAGEWVNLGIDEARSRHVLVFWSDLRLGAQTLRALSAPAGAEGPGEAAGPAAVCHVPLLRGPGGEVLPTIQVPALVRGRLKVLPFAPVRPGMSSLLPHDYCGLYERRRFQATGGYDPVLANPYWQRLDFGVRCGLWGERILWHERLELRYLEPPEADDTSADASYKPFYLKNLAVRFDGEGGVLRPSRWPIYAVRSGSGLVQSLREFRDAQEWVKRHRYRFKTDVEGLVNRWELPG